MRTRSNTDTTKKQKKRGPHYGHKGNSRKRPDDEDTTIVLELEACPYCAGELNESEEVMERYEEEIVPVPLFVIEDAISQLFLAPKISILFGFKALFTSIFLWILNC